MKIALVTLHARRSRQSVPLAAACLGASLPPRLRADATLVDLFPDQPEARMLETILSGGPALVAFSVYSWNRHAVMRLARLIKDEEPGTLLVAGGPEATADPASFLGESGFDGVVRGDGETVFPGLVEALANGRPPDAIPDVLWRNACTSSADENAAPPAAEDLASPWLTGMLEPSAGVLWETSRGCPFACDYCFDSGGKSTVRYLPQSRLEAELDLFARSGVSQVWVLDSTFNFPPPRGKQLLRLIRRKAPHIHFHFEGKSEFLDREMIRLLVEVDCSLQLGLQSIHPEVLHHIGRGFDRDDFCRKAEMLTAEGVVFGFDLIYGLPGDTLEGFRDSLDAALALAPNHLDLFRLAVLPGTVLQRQSERHGLIAQLEAPYEIRESDTWSRADLAATDLLAAAAGLFYNTGRAAGFFLPLSEVAGLTPLEFVDAFEHWLLETRQIPRERLLDAGEWTADRVLALQEGFVRTLFTDDRELLALALDLVRYHYHYAETLLGPEVLPPEPQQALRADRLDIAWKRHPDLRLVDFAYEISDLLEIGGASLEQMRRLLRPVGSTALYLRRGPEVACESLQEDFLELLRQSDGYRTPRQILPSCRPEEVDQWVEFALAEGLLIP